MRSYSALVLLALFTLCFSAGIFESLLGVTADSSDLALRFLPPSFSHLLGTDELGRDIFLRLLQGGKISLTAGLAAAILSAFIGTGVGMAAGYIGGKTDTLLMRLTDMMLALPILPLLIILAAVDLEKLGITTGKDLSLYKIIALLALFGWAGVARLVRARTLSLKKMDFVTAARALGVSNLNIVLRHILPSLMNTVIVATALAAGNTILTESVLSFLGLGIQPPTASWGNMLTNAQDNIWEHPYLALYPGMMIFITVLCCNFLGDNMQKALEPKTAKI